MTAPTCHKCDSLMVKADGVVPIWRCSCGHEIPRTEAKPVGIEQLGLPPQQSPANFIEEPKRLPEQDRAIVAASLYYCLFTFEGDFWKTSRPELPVALNRLIFKLNLSDDERRIARDAAFETEHHTMDARHYYGAGDFETEVHLELERQVVWHWPQGRKGRKKLLKGRGT